VADIEWVELESFSTEAVALVAAASLNAAGIEAIVRRYDPAGIGTLTRTVQSAQVLVNPSDEAAARRMLDSTSGDVTRERQEEWARVPSGAIGVGLDAIRKRRRTVWMIWLTYLPAGFLALVLMPSIAGYVIAAWCVAFVVSGHRLEHAPCPRCGKRYLARFGWERPWTETGVCCAHCQLPLKGKAVDGLAAIPPDARPR
jgi:hypothetical protein